VIVGKNGSGKSSLLKCISGLWKPTQGTITYDGNRSARRQQIGYLIDPPSFYESFTARDMLRYYVSVSGSNWDESKYAKLLQEWSVPSGKIKVVSRGRAIRLGIICSVWHDPDLWLLDEPFTGLDRLGAQLLWDTVNRYVQGGERTVLLVLHDGHGLPSSVSKIVEIGNSTVTFTGSPSDYFRTVLKRTCAEVPLHWQPVLAASDIKYELVGGRLRIIHDLDDAMMIQALLSAGLNPLSLVEEGEPVEI